MGLRVATFGFEFCRPPLALWSHALARAALATSHHHVEICPAVGAAPVALIPHSIQLLLRAAEIIVVITRRAPALRDARGVSPTLLLLVWPTAQHI